MAFAKNGAAMIGDVIVPASEVKVLRALVGFDKPVSVPELSIVMDGEVSDASLYTLLGRLNEKRRLVSREVVELEVMGSKVRRVTWSAHKTATSFFERSDAGEKRSEQAGVPVPAG